MTRKSKTVFEEIKSTLIEAGQWKAYKITLNKWKKGIKKISEGAYISIEKHNARPSSLNKEEKSWFLLQRITISDKITLDKLIDELTQYSKELDIIKTEIKSLENEDIENLDDDYDIVVPPHID